MGAAWPLRGKAASSTSQGLDARRLVKSTERWLWTRFGAYKRVQIVNEYILSTSD